MAFLVREYFQGDGTDLNGDGDDADEVLHLYDSSTDEIRNLGLATYKEFGDGNKILSGRRATFVVAEWRQGEDLDGNGLITGDLVYTIELPGNSPPSVEIRSPAELLSFVQGEALSFEGAVEDWQDDSLSEELVWSSTIDGEIGRGSSFSTTALSVGAHTIAADVMDSGGLTGSDSIDLTIIPPVPLALSLAINGESPASRVVSTAGPVHLTLDLSPGTVTKSLDWYYAYSVNNQVIWVTEPGLSLNPSPLGKGPAKEIHGLTLLSSLIPRNRKVVFLFFAVDGSELLSWDYIVADSSF